MKKKGFFFFLFFFSSTEKKNLSPRSSLLSPRSSLLAPLSSLLSPLSSLLSLLLNQLHNKTMSTSLNQLINRMKTISQHNNRPPNLMLILIKPFFLFLFLSLFWINHQIRTNKLIPQTNNNGTKTTITMTRPIFIFPNFISHKFGINPHPMNLPFKMRIQLFYNRTNHLKKRREKRANKIHIRERESDPRIICHFHVMVHFFHQLLAKFWFENLERKDFFCFFFDKRRRGGKRIGWRRRREIWKHLRIDYFWSIERI